MGDGGGEFTLPSSRLPMDDDLRRFPVLKRSTGVIAIAEGGDEGERERNV